MHRSSSSIGGLAAALAKAQAELINPEKSLIGSIHSDAPGGAKRIFRYAPLSAGLDIVRKALGQHEIAVVQTTAVDHAAGIVNLTSVLAHASGEWIASDWPVCAISEIATPHRMGAALTYARRYALFALVGIAGEDDLDAPDLTTQRKSGPALSVEIPNAEGRARSNGSGKHHLERVVRPQNSKRKSKSDAEPILRPEGSVGLRDRLLSEIDELGPGDDVANWAHRSLRAKNALTAADAQRVEEAFAAKLVTLTTYAAEEPATRREAAEQPAKANPGEARGRGRPPTSHRIDKTVLGLPEPRRMRDRDHVKSVAKQACLVCGRRPSDAHHLRFAQSRALGRKVSDEFTVPLCRGHHREVHRCGDETAWWKNVGIDPTVSARSLWLASHPLPVTAEDESPGAGLAAINLG